MSKNNLKNFKGKVFISNIQEGCSPTFCTGYCDYKKTKLDPFVEYHPNLDIIRTNIVWNVYATNPLHVDLKRVGKEITFTKDLKKYKADVKKVCDGVEISKEKTEYYLKVSEIMGNKKIDVDDIVKSEELRKGIKSGDLLGLLMEKI